MCHLVLLMPVLSLPLFLWLPLSIALPVYGGIVALSGWIYVLAIRATRCLVITGSEEILHSVGKVIAADGLTAQVRVHSEIWNAESTDKLQEGDRVRVTGIDGLTLKVKRLDQAMVVKNATRS